MSNRETPAGTCTSVTAVKTETNPGVTAPPRTAQAGRPAPQGAVHLTAGLSAAAGTLLSKIRPGYGARPQVTGGRLHYRYRTDERTIRLKTLDEITVEKGRLGHNVAITVAGEVTRFAMLSETDAKALATLCGWDRSQRRVPRTQTTALDERDTLDRYQKIGRRITDAVESSANGRDRLDDETYTAISDNIRALLALLPTGVPEHLTTHEVEKARRRGLRFTTDKKAAEQRANHELIKVRRTAAARYTRAANRVNEILDEFEGTDQHLTVHEFSVKAQEIEELVDDMPTAWIPEIAEEPAPKAMQRASALIADPDRYRKRANSAYLERLKAQLTTEHGAKAETVNKAIEAAGRTDEYVTKTALASAVRTVQENLRTLPNTWRAETKNHPVIKSVERARQFMADPTGTRDAAIAGYLRTELQAQQDLFDTVESKPLTEEQRRAVAIDDGRTLVNAGAGSGKTSVITAKTAWLIKRGRAKASEILVLAYNRAAADEIADRLEKRCGIDPDTVNVSTFHSLGLRIISDAEPGGARPAVSVMAADDRRLTDFIKRTTAEEIDASGHDGALAKWFAYDSLVCRDIKTFTSWSQYFTYLKQYEIRTLQGESVKSYEECLIANFLYMNGINYEYEARYPHHDPKGKGRGYRPDFHLTESGIWIEHFGIDRNGATAPFVNRKQYSAERDWKVKTHRNHGTHLIETFSYERREGRLLANFDEKLNHAGVQRKPIAPTTVFDRLNEQNRIGRFVKLAVSFLKHAKRQRMSDEDLEQTANLRPDATRCLSFIRAFRRIRNAYEEELAEKHEIDFEDMISVATDHIRSGLYSTQFKYVLVDEFQDISHDRAELVRALLDAQADSRLVAVGDDWQAIYGFAGGDITKMRRFDDTFGPATHAALETTFRSRRRLAKAAGRYITKNPDQLRRATKARRVRPAEPAITIAGKGPDRSEEGARRHNRTGGGEEPEEAFRHAYREAQQRPRLPHNTTKEGIRRQGRHNGVDGPPRQGGRGRLRSHRKRARWSPGVPEPDCRRPGPRSCAARGRELPLCGRATAVLRRVDTLAQADLHRRGNRPTKVGVHIRADRGRRDRRHRVRRDMGRGRSRGAQVPGMQRWRVDGTA